MRRGELPCPDSHHTLPLPSDQVIPELVLKYCLAWNGVVPMKSKTVVRDDKYW